MDETEEDAPAFIYIFRLQVPPSLIYFRAFLIYISSGAIRKSRLGVKPIRLFNCLTHS